MNTRKIILLTLSALLMASCSSQGNQAEVSEQTQEIINNYSSANPDFNAAYKKLVKECMAEKGYTYTEITPMQDSHTSVSGVVGLIPDEASARQGYSETLITQETSKLSPEENKALHGDENSPVVEVQLSNRVKVTTSTDSCSSKAQEKIYGSLENALYYQNFINELLSAGGEKTFQEVMESAQEELNKYSQCMEENAHLKVNVPAETAEEAGKKFGQYRESTETPKAEETQLALTDYQCQKTSHIAEKTNNLYISKIGNWLSENQDLVLKIRDIEEQAQENSVDILNS